MSALFFIKSGKKIIVIFDQPRSFAINDFLLQRRAEMAEIEANTEIEAKGDKIKELKVAKKHKRCSSSTGDISNKSFEIV